MKVFINEKNEIMQTISENKKLINVTFNYYLSHNKIYKEILKNQETVLFKYNKNTGKFDTPLSIIDGMDLSKHSDKISRFNFYTEVLNIIKRRTVLGYMINSYQNLQLDFKNLYISEVTHKTELAELISKKMDNNFTKIDVAILIENICEATRFPVALSKEIKKSLAATFYYKELEYNKMIKLVNKIVGKELEKKLPEFTNQLIWEWEYQKMMETRKNILALYTIKGK